jgi:protein TonB
MSSFRASNDGPRPSDERYTLPSSIGVSAVVQLGFVFCGLFFFEAVVDDLDYDHAPVPHAVTKLVVPLEMMKRPEAEPPAPEVVAEEPVKEEKVVRPKRRRKVVRRKAPEEVAKKPTEQKIEHVLPAKPSEDVANTSPAQSPEESAAVAREGDPKGALDAPETKEAPSPAEGFDRKALMRGYFGQLNRAVRKDYAYPLAAKRSRIEGVVLVELVVDEMGNIVRVTVVRSSGHAVLDKAAIASVRSVGKVPPLPKELGWTHKTFRVPFRYRFSTG